MKVYAQFDAGGFAVAFYSSLTHGERTRPVYAKPEGDDPPAIIGEEPNPDCVVPADATEISEEQWRAWIDAPQGYRWNGAEVEPYVPPPAPAPATVVMPADLWRRATDDEAQAIDAAMQAQPLRLRRIFQTATSYQSDDELWPLLMAAAVALFGEDRAAELLASS